MGRRNKDYPARVSDLKQAPGDLRLVQALVNTRDLTEGTDELKSPQALSDWTRDGGNGSKPASTSPAARPSTTA